MIGGLNFLFAATVAHDTHARSPSLARGPGSGEIWVVGKNWTGFILVTTVLVLICSLVLSLAFSSSLITLSLCLISLVNSTTCLSSAEVLISSLFCLCSVHHDKLWLNFRYFSFKLHINLLLM